MAKNVKTHKQRFTSFKNGFCPYCGSQGAILDEITTCSNAMRMDHVVGYRGACTNEKCKAENFFTNKKAKEWMEAVVS